MAPKALQACKERNVSQKQMVFSKIGNEYSYGMTLYEIFIGKLPFKEHAKNNYDDVLKGRHLVVPKFVEDWTRELLSMGTESQILDLGLQ